MSVDPRTHSTLADRIKEAERELAVRRKYFPKWIEDGSKSAHAATRQIMLLEGIVEDLRFLETLTTWTMFNQTPADEHGVYATK